MKIETALAKIHTFTARLCRYWMAERICAGFERSTVALAMSIVDRPYTFLIYRYSV